MNRHIFHDRKISFLNKVRISYGVLIMIPVFILELFVLYSSTSFIKEHQLIESKETIERHYQNIQNQMGICEKSILYLTSNGFLKDFLSISDDEYLKRNQDATNVSSLLYNALLSNQYFSNIEIYSDKNIAVINAIFKNIGDYDNTEWYEITMNASNTLWWYKDGKYYITRRIVSSFPEKKLGVIKIEIKKDIFSNSLSMFAEIPVKVRIYGGDMLCFEYTNAADSDSAENEYEVIKNLEGSEWQIFYGIDKSYFSNIFHPQIVSSFVIVIFLLTFGLVAVNSSTKSLLKYLYKIIDSVKEVKEDNFEIRVDESSGDEIGELARSINQMLKKIQVLIDKVYKSELDRKSLELNLLQSKINPHFLYNNLSAINWIAIENGEDRIYEITTQLASFYRTALNKGVNMDKLSVEVENIKAYLKLQLMAHEDAFDVEYHIDEKLMNRTIPIFIMQPLVENAIEHGTDTLRESRGKISIRIQEESGTIVIWIKDNGMELYKKIGNNKMPISDYGYGVSNVHNRIQLLCGASYGVEIMADGTGTTSVIRIQ